MVIFSDVSLNDTGYVLQALIELGINLSCQNKFEVEKVAGALAEAGGNNTNVLLDGTSKVASHLRHASANGVGLLVCGSALEMRKIQTAAPNSRLLLKLDPGTEYVEAHWKTLFEAASTLGLTVVGLSVDGLVVGGGETACQPQERSKAAAIARLIFELGMDCGQECMTLIDVGRVGTAYTLDAEVSQAIQMALIADKSTACCTKLDKFHGFRFQICKFLDEDLLRQFDNYVGGEVEVMCHPGEFLLASAASLAVRIIEKRVAFRNGSRHCSYFVGESVFESFAGPMYGAESGSFKDVESLMGGYSEEVDRSGSVTSCDIFGETGGEGDIISQGTFVNEVNVGDWLIFPNMGCYAMNCSFERPVGTFFPIAHHGWEAGTQGHHGKLWYYVKSGPDDDVVPPFPSQTNDSDIDNVEECGMMMSLSEDSMAGSLNDQAFDGDDSFGNYDWC